MFDPKRYEENKEGVNNILNKVFVPKLTNAMKGISDGNFLDYGCGPGGTGFNFLLPLVKETNSRLYSVDICPEMVKFAEQNFPHHLITYKSGCFPASFPFTDLKFDRIVSVNVFHLIQDIRPTLKGFMGILKSGGLVGINSTTIDNIMLKMMKLLSESQEWGKYMEDCQKVLPVWSAFKGDNPEEYFRKYFGEEAGFSVNHLEYASIKATWEAQEALDLCISMNPCVCKLPRALMGDLYAEYRRMFASILNVPYNATSYCVTVDYLSVILQKPL